MLTAFQALVSGMSQLRAAPAPVHPAAVLTALRDGDPACPGQPMRSRRTARETAPARPGGGAMIAFLILQAVLKPLALNVLVGPFAPPLVPPLQFFLSPALILFA